MFQAPTRIIIPIQVFDINSLSIYKPNSEYFAIFMRISLCFKSKRIATCTAALCSRYIKRTQPSSRKRLHALMVTYYDCQAFLNCAKNKIEPAFPFGIYELCLGGEKHYTGTLHIYILHNNNNNMCYLMHRHNVF